MDEKFYEDLRKRIRPYFGEEAGHGFDHTERVYNIALKISEGESVDLDIIKTETLLHDIARHKQEIGEINCHAEEGAKIAGQILKSMDFPEDKIKKVVDAISVHRYSKGLNAETKEAEILQDADRLDALGAIAVARIFTYVGKKGKAMYDSNLEPQEYNHNYESTTAINHFKEKILKITPDKFNTKKAKEIARDRYKFVEEFLDRFLKEWSGEL